jgi:hypothetical protein
MIKFEQISPKKKKEIHHEDKFKINQMFKKNINLLFFFLKKYSNDKILD